jgi:CheY-like chemotaxis protein
MSRYRVLVVDDKENMLRLFGKILGDLYELTTASDGAAALELLTEQRFDLVVSDVRMPGASGFEVLRAARAGHDCTEVVLLTAYASVEDAVEAIKQGAYDYLQKPFEPEHVLRVVGRAIERKLLLEQTNHFRRDLAAAYGFDQLVGKSPPMRSVYNLLQRASEMDITVLITGETGTGKELAARAVHQASARKKRRFLAINCGALPPDLVESELFGHVKGAFTGASAARAGLFEEAAGGTLFLDEVGELPHADGAQSAHGSVHPVAAATLGMRVVGRFGLGQLHGTHRAFAVALLGAGVVDGAHLAHPAAVGDRLGCHRRVELAALRGDFDLGHGSRRDLLRRALLALRRGIAGDGEDQQEKGGEDRDEFHGSLKSGRGRRVALRKSNYRATRTHASVTASATGAALISPLGWGDSFRAL